MTLVVWVLALVGAASLYLVWTGRLMYYLRAVSTERHDALYQAARVLEVARNAERAMFEEALRHRSSQ